MTTELSNKPPYFSAPRPLWWRAIGYLLCLALVGLKVYPALLLVIALLVRHWREDRHWFMVEVMLLCGGFASIGHDALPVRLADVAFICGIVGMVIYRKNPIIKKITRLMLLYFAGVIAIACTSTEPLSIQFFTMRNYFYIVSFFIPLVIFANHRFDWERFMNVVIIYALTICGFYVVDTFILNGGMLLPASLPWATPTILHPYLHPFSFDWPRHYPQSLYWLLLCIIPLTYHKVRFSGWQWLLIALALFASRTNSLLFALLTCFIIFRPKLKQVALYAAIGVIGLAGGYVVDKATGGHMRLASNLEQFSSLEKAADDEDLAEFGTGRMAQILPKWQLLDDLDRMWLGFGFLHPTKTTNPIYQIHNKYYTDQSRAEETATQVEVTEVQTILDIGFLGLIMQALVYIGFYLIIRKLNYSKYYLCALVGVEILGVGGFAGLNNIHGLFILATVLAAIVLADKTTRSA